MAEKLGTNALVADPLVRRCLEVHSGDFPRPNGTFHKDGPAIIELGVR